LLAQVDMDRHIPPALYVAVAELLAWLYRIERGDAAADAPAPTFRTAGTGGDSG
jgi:flagellar biosynthesis protein